MFSPSQILKEDMNELLEDRIKNIPQDFHDKINHLRQDVRTKAIDVLFSWFQLSFSKQELSKYFLERNDFSSALSILITLIKNSEEVFDTTIEDVWIITTKYLESLKNEEKNNLEYISLNEKISTLISLCQKEIEYKENPKMKILFSQELLRNWNTKKSLEILNDLLEDGYAVAYFYLWKIYTQMWEYQFAVSLLENWWNITWKVEYVYEMIDLYIKIWNKQKALEYYKLVSNDIYDEVWVWTQWILPPFSYFSWEINSIKDVQSIEIFLQQILKNPEIESIEKFTKLLQILKEYIDNTIEEIEIKLDNTEDENIWKELAMERLYLIHISITLLGETIYLKAYLQECENLLLSEEDELNEFIDEFFEEYIKPSFSYKALNDKNTQNQDDEEKPSMESFLDYLDEIIQKHFHGRNFESIKTFVIDFYNNLSEKLLSKIDYQWQNDTKTILWNEYEFLDQFSAIEKNLYANFINEFDKKHSPFFRNLIEQFARWMIFDEEEKIHKLIKTNPDFSLLYVIELVICWYLSDEWIDDVDDFLLKYNLNKLKADDKILCAIFFYYTDADLCVNYLIKNNGLLDSVYGLYYFLSSLKVLWYDKKIIKELNTIIQNDFQEKWLISFIKKRLKTEKNSPDINKLDKEYIALCESMIDELSENFEDNKLLNFHQNNTYTSTKVLLEIWDNYVSSWDFEKWLKYYLDVYQTEKNILVISKIITTYLYLNDFVNADRFINIWENFWNMVYYRFSYYVWKNEFKNALGTFILLSKKWDIIDEPKNTMENFWNMLQSQLHTEHSWDSHIFSVSILSNFAINILNTHFYWRNYKNIFDELDSILSILLEAKKAHFPKMVFKTLLFIMDENPSFEELPFEIDENEASFSKALLVLEFYFFQRIQEMKDIFYNSPDLTKKQKDEFEKDLVHLFSVYTEVCEKIPWWFIFTEIAKAKFLWSDVEVYIH